MKNVKEIELLDVLKELPNITSLDCDKDFSDDNYDVFFCALGFEERCLTIPDKLANVKNLKCVQALYFEYLTNTENNSVNRPRLIGAFEKFAESWDTLQCDNEDFTDNLRKCLSRLNECQQSNQKLKVILDISVCSSKLILSAIKVFFEFDIYLKIVYSEAITYHPTYEEFQREPEKWTTEEGFGIAQGVSNVIPSPEYPGIRRENPDLIIAFPTFKPERTNTIITYIDEAALMRQRDRIIWIIGDPHMDEDIKQKRKDIIRKINKIPDDIASYEVSTFDYKETLKALEGIYKNKGLEYHMNISALGSKMQSLGISVFAYIRPDVSVYLAIPQKYNPSQYSEGCKATWQINFGDLTNIRNILNKEGKLEVINYTKTRE